MKYPARRPRRPADRHRHLLVRPDLERIEPRVLLSTFTVTTTSDFVPGSLREAITKANNEVDPAPPATIAFDIAGPSLTIHPTAALPQITRPVAIDGTTQHSYAGRPVIRIDGSSITGLAIGLDVSAGSSTIRGLAIGNFQSDAIRLDSKSGNVIAGNSLGAFDQAFGDGNRVGLRITDGSSRNTIGGLNPGDGNVLSGNSVAGLEIDGGRGSDEFLASSNLIIGNFIGTDFLGASALPNIVDGVLIISSPRNTIGGSAAGARNLISGNNQHGVEITGKESSGSVIQGNYIGTDNAGESDLGNGQNGVTINGSPQGTIIGGNLPGQGNLISGNDTYGISLASGSGQTLVAGNSIGMKVSGMERLPNSLGGISIRSSSNNTIGGATDEFRNFVAGNDGDGISISEGADRNQILGNWVGTTPDGSAALGNSLSGINISGVGPDFLDDVHAVNLVSGNLVSGNGRHGIFLTTGGNNTLVIGNLMGTNAEGTGAIPNAQDGLKMGGSTGSTIGGTGANMANTISGNTLNGVETGSNATQNLILGNLIGIVAAGGQAIPNIADGILINGIDNTIGGSVAGAANTIAGNGSNGVEIGDKGTRNVIRRNFIGFAPKTSTALANGGDGVLVLGSDNTVGGDTREDGSVISGNRGVGVGVSSLQNVVAFNSIGTNSDETAAIPNHGGGLRIGQASSTRIVGNAISGNDGDGMFLFDAVLSVIEGNWIGTDRSATAALPNGGNGIALAIIDGITPFGIAFGNTIGGSTSASANVIAHNHLDGISTGVSATNNLIQGNLILANDLDGIQIQGHSETINANVIAGNGAAGVRLTPGYLDAGHTVSIPSSDVLIHGNMIGVEADGVSNSPNGAAGILLDRAQNVTIDGNQIVGGGAEGVLMTSASLTLVAGNRISTTGALDAARVAHATVRLDGTSAVTIGGPASSHRGNTITAGAREGNGIELQGDDSTVIAGNLIGGQAAQTPATTGGHGIRLEQSVGSTIGGADVPANAPTSPADSANTISGNAGFGIAAYHGSSLAVILGNLIGVSLDGQKGRSNAGGGILLDQVSDIAVGVPGVGNQIANAGVTNVVDRGGTSNSFFANRIRDPDLDGANLGVATAEGRPPAGYLAGIALFGTTEDNIGTVVGGGNLIAGNGGEGVYLDRDSARNQIASNTIGGTSGFVGNFDGIWLDGGGSNSLTGNLVTGNRLDGVLITGSSNVLGGNLIEGSGVHQPGDPAYGVEVDGPDNRIGDDFDALGNTISGNAGAGILLRPGAARTLIVANLIGTDATGKNPSANGVGLMVRATHVTIGGPSSVLGNLISGNSGDGIVLDGADDALIEANSIGTDITGTFALANGEAGIHVMNSNRVRIGLDPSGDYQGNFISGNQGDGILIEGDTIPEIAIAGNLFGRDLLGRVSSNLGNGGAGINYVGPALGAASSGTALNITANQVSSNHSGGIAIADNRVASVIQSNVVTDNVDSSDGIRLTRSSHVTVGGDYFTGNTIATNGGNGLSIVDRSSEVLVLANFIGGNGGDGILIDTDPTNDASRGSFNNTIGSAVYGNSSIISGNRANGVRIHVSTNNVVINNQIGQSVAGPGNAFNGILISDAPSNVLRENIVAGNGGGGSGSGIAIMGASPGNGVVGNFLDSNSVGMTLASTADNTVGGRNDGEGNTISGSTLDGLRVTGAARILVVGNLVETNGSPSQPAFGAGIVVDAATAVTIGASTGRPNVISGNLRAGIVYRNGANSGLILGNRIGVDLSASLALPNGGDGVSIDSTTGVTIGGTASGASNVIAGNVGQGVAFSNGSSGGRVLGNWVGTNSIGAVGIGNRGDGVLVMGSDDVLIGGTDAGDANVVSGNLRNGVEFSGGSARGRVQGNVIGLNSTSGAPTSLPNLLAGVAIVDSPSNSIGGGTGGEANTISGNAQYGVEISGKASTQNLVAGNLIGTDASRTRAIGNVLSGIFVHNGASSNILGGGNWIAGSQMGIDLEGGDTTSNLVEANLIGTDGSAIRALGNNVGVVIRGAAFNTIGGATGNVISGSRGDGLQIVAGTENLVLGNRIGTDASGTAALSNGVNGVFLQEASGNRVVDNLISGNAASGVQVTGGSATSNSISGNTIGASADAMRAIANGQHGVFLLDAGAGNVVGGPNPGDGNTISGNLGDGILVDHAIDELVQGNLIGRGASRPTRPANVGIGVEFKGVSRGKILGNTIAGNGGSGVMLGATSSGNTIAGNTIGGLTRPLDLGNAADGVLVVDSSSNAIGGEGPGEGNVILGNHGAGIHILAQSSGATGNLIIGNRIGTDAAGGVAVANTGDGVLIEAASGTQVGSDREAGRNLISGNGQNGVHITGGSASGNLVLGNRIGTDRDGAGAIPNSAQGVFLENAPANSVGRPGAGNLISGNGADGVLIQGATARGNVVAGNRIGTNASATAPIANVVGVFLSGAPENLIGAGTFDAGGNVISGNTVGVVISDAGAISNRVSGNRIGTDGSGRVALENGTGVLINDVPGNTIGGANLISGNVTAGVNIQGRNARGNVVAGNLIGPDISGMGFLIDADGSRQQAGVLISDAVDNLIGGMSDAARNVISGNEVGVVLGGYDPFFTANSKPNRIAGNYIGVGRTGASPLGNVQGVYIVGVPFVLVGGPERGAGNVISANTSVGVYIYGALATGDAVQGNIIGLAADGHSTFATDASGNTPVQTTGVFIQDATRNVIGGAGRAGNVLSGNSTAVYLLGSSGSNHGNTILGNLIGRALGGGRGPGNAQYGVLLYNAPANTVVRTGKAANRFGRNGIADVREFSGAIRRGKSSQTPAARKAKSKSALPLHHPRVVHPHFLRSQRIQSSHP